MAPQEHTRGQHTPEGAAHDAGKGAVRAFLAAERADLVEHLIGWVRLRSVAANPDNAVDLLRSANWLAGVLRDNGFPTVEVWRTEGAPAVFARWHAAPGAPTVLVYSHHDVRAAKDDHWEQCPPFEPALRDGRLYGRGASDAKGQVLAHVWGLRAHLAATGRDAPAVNLTVLVEGEEEVNSPHLADLLAEHHEELHADLVVLSDTMTWSAQHPAVCVGVRGSLSAELEVYGPRRDVHSGAVSGPAPNPALELAKLLAQLHDEQHRITLPDFYDAVAEPSAAEREGLARLPYSDEDWTARSSTRSVGGEVGWTVPERLYLRPAVEVTSLISGDPIGPTRGAVPAVATVSLTFRSVPDQRVAEIADQLRRWVDERISDRFEYRLTVSEDTGQEPYATPADHPALGALHAAMEDGFDTTVGHMRNAGGAPAYQLATTLDAPLIFFGTGLPEDNWHDSDESVHLDTLINGAASLAHLWSRLGAR